MKDNSDYIDLSVLPIHKEKKNFGKPNWENSINIDIPFKIKEIVGFLKIIEYRRKSKILVEYEGRTRWFSTDLIKNMKFYKFLQEYSSDFKFNVGDIVNNYKITNRKFITKNGIRSNYYQYLCLVCGFSSGEHYNKYKQYNKEFWILESNIKQGCKCSCCTNQIVVIGINDIPTKDKWMVKYFRGGYDEAKLYCSGSNKELKFICPDCRNIKDRPMQISTLYKSRTIACPHCSDGISYPEKFMYNLLKQLSIDFEYQKKFDWCKYKLNGKQKYGLYDFYIPSVNLIIEINGMQHYEHNWFETKGGRTLHEEQENDKLKEKLAKENGVKKYIILDARKSELGWIKNSILNSELYNLFDFSIVDWNEVDVISLKSIVKEVCDFYNMYCSCPTTILQEKYKLSISSIIRFLKIGDKYNWCKYSPNLSKSKSIIVEQDNKSYIYNSAISLSNNSVKIHGMFLNIDCIRECCRGERSLKGINMEYLDDLILKDDNINIID